MRDRLLDTRGVYSLPHMYHTIKSEEHIIIKAQPGLFLCFTRIIKYNTLSFIHNVMSNGVGTNINGLYSKKGGRGPKEPKEPLRLKLRNKIA